MKPDQLNHLKLIDAHLDKLLALAAKRTTGEWEADDGWGVMAVKGREITHEICYSHSSEDDASFIAACAGNAEAGWVATKGMIMLIFGYEELSKTLTAPLTLEAVNIARDSILESILIAWPLTRITP